jgi:threonine dehydrogenase-like Zn-dependent dehydrogenase
MRALVFDGELRVGDAVPVPVPGDAEAMIRVRMAGICGTDLEIVRGYKGFNGILGHEFVGEVVAAPTQTLKGRRVAGEINVGCGACERCRAGARTHCGRRAVLGILNRAGAFAELVTLPAENLHVLPDTVEDRRAVFVEPLAAAFEMLEQVEVHPGVSVAVLGDGRLGNLCAQVMKLAGAAVTVIGHHDRKLALLRRLNITTAMPQESRAAPYDVVVEATGSSSGLDAALSRVRPRGTLILKSTYAGAAPVDLSPAVVNEVTIVGSRCGPFERAITALACRDVDVEPMIDAVYPLELGLEAMKHAASPGAMKVLLRMEP